VAPLATHMKLNLSHKPLYVVPILFMYVTSFCFMGLQHCIKPQTLKLKLIYNGHMMQNIFCQLESSTKLRTITLSHKLFMNQTWTSVNLFVGFNAPHIELLNFNFFVISYWECAIKVLCIQFIQGIPKL